MVKLYILCVQDVQRIVRFYNIAQFPYYLFFNNSLLTKVTAAFYPITFLFCRFFHLGYKYSWLTRWNLLGASLSVGLRHDTTIICSTQSPFSPGASYRRVCNEKFPGKWRWFFPIIRKFWSKFDQNKTTLFEMQLFKLIIKSNFFPGVFFSSKFSLF